MSSFHIPINSLGSSQELFAGMPQSIKAYISEGFQVLSKIPRDKWDEIRRVTLESVETGSGVGDKDLSSRLDISINEARSVITAASLFATLLLRRDEKAAPIVAAAVEAKVVRAEDSAAVIAFYEIIDRDRAIFKDAIEGSEVSNEVLPSLLEFESTVDLRLRFEKGRLSFAAPIALIHLDTDAQGQEVWLQLRKKQVERIVRDLQEVLHRMDEVEKWAGSKARKQE